jgi:ABC-type transport system involved in Fe-S cluster assembly fused permease/ATPase subunit
MSSDTDAASKEATLLAGDSIINYRTVASFANEDQIVASYARLLDEPVKISIRKCHIIAIVFGFS